MLNCFILLWNPCLGVPFLSMLNPKSSKEPSRPSVPESAEPLWPYLLWLTWLHPDHTAPATLLLEYAPHEACALLPWHAFLHISSWLTDSVLPFKSAHISTPQSGLPWPWTHQPVSPHHLKPRTLFLCILFYITSPQELTHSNPTNPFLLLVLIAVCLCC